MAKKQKAGYGSVPLKAPGKLRVKESETGTGKVKMGKNPKIVSSQINARDKRLEKAKL